MTLITYLILVNSFERHLIVYVSLKKQVNTRVEAIKAERDGVDLIVAQGLAWPPQYPGRALRNRFTDQWHSHVDLLPQDNEARQQLAEAISTRNYDLAHIYAGQAVELVTQQQSAGEVIRYLGDGAELLLRERAPRLLEGHDTSRKE